jgi:hypothetical protein
MVIPSSILYQIVQQEAEIDAREFTKRPVPLEWRL